MTKLFLLGTFISLELTILTVAVSALFQFAQHDVGGVATTGWVGAGMLGTVLGWMFGFGFPRLMESHKEQLKSRDEQLAIKDQQLTAKDVQIRALIDSRGTELDKVHAAKDMALKAMAEAHERQYDKLATAQDRAKIDITEALDRLTNFIQGAAIKPDRPKNAKPTEGAGG